MNFTGETKIMDEGFKTLINFSRDMPSLTYLEIKAEAIKWHKEFKKMKRQITIKDWELFFNIEEENLK